MDSESKLAVISLSAVDEACADASHFNFTSNFDDSSVLGSWAKNK